MDKIYIIGLGPGSIDSLTLGAVNRINSGQRNYLRTEKHPTVKYFNDKKIEYKTYDYLYEKEDDFKEVYEKIVVDLIEEFHKYGTINYYVPGNPLVAEKTVELLLEKNIDLEIVSGMSFIEPMIELVGRDPVNGLKLVDGDTFSNLDVDINTDMIITQVYNARILTDIKIVLAEIYGDDYKVYFIEAAGVEGLEKKELIPIYELDRNYEASPLTSIYVPKVDKIDNKVFDFYDILGIMKILRSENGCPWDMKQTRESIRMCLIEEAYELVDEIDKADIDGIVEELGDLLFQIVFHCHLGEEEGEFSLYEVTTKLANKLIYRHPHVFSKKTVENSQEVVYNWNKLKYAERNISKFTDRLKDIPKLPSLMTSFKIQEKAAEIGFDWDNIQGPIDKVKEEFHEVIEAMETNELGHEKIEEEMGDLLFAVVNFSRFLQVSPELALNRTINKFIKRFEIMEKAIEDTGKDFDQMTLEEMDLLWNKAKEVLQQ